MNTIGIRSEEKHWESRVTIAPNEIPLLPESLTLKFQQENERHLPFKKRIFSDRDLLEAGARGGAKVKIAENLRDCKIIIGTKEIKECGAALDEAEAAFVPRLAKELDKFRQVVFDEQLRQMRLTDFLLPAEKQMLRAATRATPLQKRVSELIKTQEALIGADTVHVFFSHTHKGQTYNMRMLHELMKKRCTLIDYELLREPTNGGSRRTVAYSRWAGIIGALETLWTYGEHAFRRLGIDSPFRRLHAPECYCGKKYEYLGLEQARQVVSEIGRQIETGGLPMPVRVALTGWRGTVGSAAVEVLTDWGLPVREVAPEKLAAMRRSDFDLKTIYLTKLDYPTLYRAREGVEIPPSEIRSLIREGSCRRLQSNLDRYFPRIDIFLNCIVWNPNGPRLLTNSFLREFYDMRKSETDVLLPVIGDITCDPNGSVQCCRDTYPNAPSYIWAPERTDEPIAPDHDLKKEAPDAPCFDLSRRGYAVMAVTNLPCEIPRDASISFSLDFCRRRDSLGEKSYLECLAEADFEAPLGKSGLPEPIVDATILYQGKFNGASKQALFNKVCIALLESAVLDARDLLPMTD